MNECQQCKLWDQAAKESGYASGMCEECYNKDFFAVNLEYSPKLKEDLEEDDKPPV